MPVNTFIKVDFPAPFSPAIARTSPLFSSKCTESRALTPGKLLEIFSILNKLSISFNITPSNNFEISQTIYKTQRTKKFNIKQCQEILLFLFHQTLVRLALLLYNGCINAMDTHLLTLTINYQIY